MPVWPILMALAAAVFIAAVLSWDRRYVLASGVMLATFPAGRLMMLALPSDVLLPAFSFMCIAAAGIVLSCRTRPLVVAAGFMAAGGLCYVWAKATGAAWVFLSPPFVAADLCAVAAMICMATGVRSAILDRGWYLGRFDYRRNGDTIGRVSLVQEEKGAAR